MYIYHGNFTSQDVPIECCNMAREKAPHKNSKIKKAYGGECNKNIYTPLLHTVNDGINSSAKIPETESLEEIQIEGKDEFLFMGEELSKAEREIYFGSSNIKQKW